MQPTSLSQQVQLNRHQLKIASLVAEGLSDKEIAHRTQVVLNTAKHNVKNIRAKLGLRNRAELAAWYVRNYEK